MVHKKLQLISYCVLCLLSQPTGYVIVTNKPNNTSSLVSPFSGGWLCRTLACSKPAEAYRLTCLAHRPGTHHNVTGCPACL